MADVDSSAPSSSSSKSSKHRLSGLLKLRSGRSKSPGPYAGRTASGGDGLRATTSQDDLGDAAVQPDGELGLVRSRSRDADASEAESNIAEKESIKRDSTHGNLGSSDGTLRPLRPVRSLGRSGLSSTGGGSTGRRSVLTSYANRGGDLQDSRASQITEGLTAHDDGTISPELSIHNRPDDHELSEHEYATSDDERTNYGGNGSDDDPDYDDLNAPMDPVLAANTEANAGHKIHASEYLSRPEKADVNAAAEGVYEGPNIIASREGRLLRSHSYLASTLMLGDDSPTSSTENLLGQQSAPFTSRTGRGRRLTFRSSTVKLVTSRPVFERNRCTLTLTQGEPHLYAAQQDQTTSPAVSRPSSPPRTSLTPGLSASPDSMLAPEQHSITQPPLESSLSGLSIGPRRKMRRKKTYVVASDLSEEAYYAIEWAIGTVLRSGDELLFVSVMETDSKLDPEISRDGTERSGKIRNQQERQTKVLQLAREATSLLERTRLHVTVMCQAIHAKNARHMLIDLIDYIQPVLVITGSRGLSRLKATILGSTSHYLIQKSSSPVMVTRKRLKAPSRPKRAVADLQREPRVDGLGNATIDKESHGGVIESGPSDAETDVDNEKEAHHA